MLEHLFPDSGDSSDPLPDPTVEYARSGTPPQQWTEEMIRGIVTNPIYAGVGPYSPLIDDAKWIRNCEKLIEQEGARQFLVNLLYVLRRSFPAG